MRPIQFLALTFLVLPSFLACSAANGSDDVTEYVAAEEHQSETNTYDWTTSYTKAAKPLIVPASNVRLQMATPDRSRAVFSTSTADGTDCTMHLVDAAAGTSLPIISSDACLGYGEITAMSPTGDKVAMWSRCDATDSYSLTLWQDGANQVTVANHPGEPFTNELRFLQLTDSHLLYSTRGVGDAFILWAYDIAAETTTMVHGNVPLIDPVFDPSRTKFLHRIDMVGANEMALHNLALGTSIPVATGIAWDPDQQQVSPDGRIVTVLNDCENDTCNLTIVDFSTDQVFNVDTNVSMVAGFASQGQSLAYVSEGTLKVWDFVQGAKTAVAGPGICWAAATPVGERAVFISDCDDSGVGVLKVAELGSTVKVSTLASGVESTNTVLRFSPDGQRFARIVQQSWTHNAWLEVWDLKTGKQDTVGKGMGTLIRSVGAFQFAPGGRKLVYERSTGWIGPCPPYGVCGYRELRSFDFDRYAFADKNIEGGSLSTPDVSHALADIWGPVPLPARSPDGTLMAYTSSSEPVLGAVYTLELDTLKKRRVPSSNAFVPVLVTESHLLVARQRLGSLEFDGLFVIDLE